VWIYQLTNDYVNYTYTTDEEVINLLLSDNGFHVGYYVLSALETQKVDLTGYVKDTDYATTTKAGLIKASSYQGFYIGTGGELSIVKAQDSDIDNRTNPFRPITPTNLDYAVGSVKASETQSGTAKMWTSTNEDGETGLNISTEV
jgi:hypothetical protein